MLRIHRGPVPTEFVHLVEEPKQLLLDWLRRPERERRQRRAPINDDIFHNRAVISPVWHEFNGRCAYCESEVPHDTPLHHFRPTAEPLEVLPTDDKDHYAWLAYDWLNLFIACPACSKAKGRWFPVRGRRAAFLATLDEVRKRERNLIVDPTREAPAAHLEFLVGGYCAPKSGKGKTTIRLLELNRPDLVAARRRAIDETWHRWREVVMSFDPYRVRGLLENGPFIAARRDVIRRSVNEYGLAPTHLGNGPDLERKLERLLRATDSDARDRFQESFEQLRSADEARERRIRAERVQVSIAASREVIQVETELVPVPTLAKYELAGIEIANLKAVDHLELSLPPQRASRSGAPCLMLLGENAVGKSTCLAGIALALVGTREASALQIPYSELAHSIRRDGWDQLGEEPISVGLSFHSTGATAEFHYDPIQGVLDGTTDQTAIVLGYGPHRYFAPTKGNRNAAPRERIRSLFDPLRPIPDPSDWLIGLKGARFEAVARTVRTILPIGDDDHLENHPKFGICVQTHGQLTPIHRLSEGYRSVFAMVVDICRELLDHWGRLEDAQAVVLIDEIETHLHPRWKMRVMSSLRRALPRVQFIVTSHDPLCIRGMDNGEVSVLARDEDGRIHTLKDLPDVVGMKAEQLLTSEYFGLASTIDPDLEIQFAELTADPRAAMGSDVSDLIARLTIGDTAAEQIIHEALHRYLLERERPVDSLSPSARSRAVYAVVDALRGRWARG